MNGIEKITERITAEANAACQEIAAAAAERCGAIRQEYEEKARNAYDQAFAKGKDEIEQFSRRQDRTVRLDVKKDLLAQKQDLVGEAYRFARDRILGLPEEEYVRFLAREAGNAALTGREEILLNAADRERVGTKVAAAANALAAERGLPGELTLSEETRPISGGVVLRQGDVEVNCALDTLLELSRGSLDAEVARLLFQ